MGTFTVHTDSAVDPTVTVEADTFDWSDGLLVFTASGNPGGNRLVAVFNGDHVVYFKANWEAE